MSSEGRKAILAELSASIRLDGSETQERDP